MKDSIISEYNQIAEVKREYHFEKDVFIIDSTIRSLQSGISGSKHTAKDLIDIGLALDAIGVKELIVNLSWKDGFEVCEGLAKENLNCKLVGTFRARHPNWETWMQHGLEVGVDEICFESAPNTDYLKKAADLVHSKGRTVSHAFAEYYTYDEILNIINVGKEYDYKSQSFHDSFLKFGITPEAIKYFIRSIKKDVSDCPPLYIHLSNFYGHATMTAVAAIVAGANAADVCFNGVGHHCGHIQLAQIVMVLEVLYGIKTGIKLEKLFETSKLIQRRTGVPMLLDSPVTGDYTFMIDGFYWAAEVNIPYSDRVHAKFPFPPDSVGSQERVIWSENTITTDVVKEKLALMKLKHEEGDVGEIIKQLTRVMQQKNTYPMWLDDAEFEKLCKLVVEDRAKERV